MNNNSSIKPATFPAISPADMTLRNLLCGKSMNGEFSAEDQSVAIRLLPNCPTFRNGIAITLNIAGFSPVVVVEPDVAQLVIGDQYGLSELPEPLLVACVEQTFTEVWRYLAQYLQCDVTIKQVVLATTHTADAPLALGSVAVGIECLWSDHCVGGQLLMEETMAVWLAEKLMGTANEPGLLDRIPNKTMQWPTLSTPLLMTVAKSSLTNEALRHLKVNDIVLFEDIYGYDEHGNPTDQCLLEVPGAGKYHARYVDQTVTILSKEGT